MSGSNLTPFNFIPENSLATPGLWNSVFSTLSQNIAEANTGSVLSGGISLGTQGLTINVPSNVTDYIFLNDSANLRSSYVIGSFNTGTADGLNIWDASGQTMLVSFSKQSIRFFQQVVGPVFDVGGALASTLNAATFGGSDITTQIQAAISAATNAIPKIKRVYIPASMYPYKATKVTFDPTVQMVREGGDWSVYDVFAYGAVGVGTDAASIQAAANAASVNNGICYFPPATYNVDTSITLANASDVHFQGPGGNGALVAMAANGVTLLNFTGVCSRIIIRDLWLGSFVSFATGGSISVVGTTGVHSDTVEITNVTCQNTPNPIVMKLVDRNTLRNVRIQQSIAGAVKGNALSFQTVISTVVESFEAFASAGSFPTDVVTVDNNCDTILFAYCDVLHATGSAFQCYNSTGTNGPRLLRFTNCLTESNTSSGFDIQTARSVRLNGCSSHINGRSGYAISGGNDITITDSYAQENTQHGILVTGGTAVKIDGCDLTNNSLNSLNGYDGIHIESGVSGVRIVNNRSGNFIFSAESYQRYGLSIATSTDYLIIDGNDLQGNSIAGMQSLSTGTNNFILDSSILTTSATSNLALQAALWLPTGSATAPAMAFTSEQSLGWYRSAASVMQLSYGTLAVSVFSSLVPAGYTPAFKVSSGNRLFTGVTNGSFNIEVGTLAIADGDGGAGKGRIVANSGSATFPTYAYTQELGLGWWRSANSVMALSYGGLGIKAGANASCGTAVLGSNGSVNVANTYVAAGDLIFLTDQTPGGTLGDLELGGIRAGSGFTIQSTSITDTSTVGWLIVRPT